MEPALFRFKNHYRRFNHQSLIRKPTTVQKLNLSVETRYDIYAKREDLTDALYGGNKVRNLEFLFGDAIARGYRSFTTVAPKGSNFIAALAAQAKRVGLEVDVDHFVPAHSSQIEAHYQFSRSMGTRLTLFPGRRGAIPAAIQAYHRSLKQKSLFLTPGGSHPIGVLGHVNAVLELAEQVELGALPRPDSIVVGVGTCGTIAGLLVGLKLLGWNTKVLGVRCVDKIVCHRRKIVSLSNRTLQLMGERLSIEGTEIHLNDIQNSAYGIALPDFEESRLDFWEREKLVIDSTYTGKVVRYLTESAVKGVLPGEKVVYWHTFSPAAVKHTLGKSLPPASKEKYIRGHAEADAHHTGAI